MTTPSIATAMADVTSKYETLNNNISHLEPNSSQYASFIEEMDKTSAGTFNTHKPYENDAERVKEGDYILIHTTQIKNFTRPRIKTFPPKFFINGK